MVAPANDDQQLDWKWWSAVVALRRIDGHAHPCIDLRWVWETQTVCNDRRSTSVKSANWRVEKKRVRVCVECGSRCVDIVFDVNCLWLCLVWVICDVCGLCTTIFLCYYFEWIVCNVCRPRFYLFFVLTIFLSQTWLNFWIRSNWVSLNPIRSNPIQSDHNLILSKLDIF